MKPPWLGLQVALLTLAVIGPPRGPVTIQARTYEVFPATIEAGAEEAFERLANALEPGDELMLHGGTYSQTERRAVTARGTADRPIVVRAAPGEAPLLTRPAEQRDRHNNRPAPARPAEGALPRTVDLDLGETEEVELWDGARARIKSDGNAQVHAPDGYAVTEHGYREPGDYLARVERVNEHGSKAMAQVHVRVGPAPVADERP